MDERPFHQRLLALIALIALAVAGGVSSYWILTDQAQFAPPELTAAAAATATNRLEAQP